MTTPQYFALVGGALVPVSPGADRTDLFVRATTFDAMHATLIDAQATLHDMSADRAHRAAVTRRLAEDLRNHGVPAR